MKTKTLITKQLAALGIKPETEVAFRAIGDYDAEVLDRYFSDIESRAEFFLAADEYLYDIKSYFADNGVDFVSFEGTVIACDAEIGEGTLIYPNVQIRSGAVIGKNCVIGSGSVIENSKIGDGCNINATQIYGSTLDENVKIGPFSHVRPGTHLHAGVKVGDFVEIKNSDVGENTHASHLTYIGDSDVGADVNFGCGTVTSNYDGREKHRTIIGDGAFIGCNTNLVAPVTVGEHGYTAAGSTVTKDVPPFALAISRSKQINLEGWVKGREKEENDSAK
ncbi:MAG: hypothetical protein WCQ72_06835 [Eubacteriales bacterium]